MTTPSNLTTIHSHLTDPSLTPLLTTAPAGSHPLHLLTTLSSAALSACPTTLRLGLGAPRRILVEYPSGALVLTSFIAPPPSPPAVRACTARSEAGVGEEGEEGGELKGGETDGMAPPVLVAVVSAPPGEGRGARRAAARLEKVGARFQREWTVAQNGEDEEHGEG